MSAAETLIVIFVFGVGMSFLLLKGIWQAKDFHHREVDQEKLTVTSTSPGKGLLSESSVSGL